MEGCVSGTWAADRRDVQIEMREIRKLTSDCQSPAASPITSQSLRPMAVSRSDQGYLRSGIHRQSLQ